MIWRFYMIEVSPSIALLRMSSLALQARAASRFLSPSSTALAEASTGSRPFFAINRSYRLTDGTRNE